MEIHKIQPTTPTNYEPDKSSCPPHITEIFKRFFTSLVEPFTRDIPPFIEDQRNSFKRIGPWSYISTTCFSVLKKVRKEPLNAAYLATGALAQFGGADDRMLQDAFAVLQFLQKTRDLSKFKPPFLTPQAMGFAFKLGTFYFIASSSLPAVGAESVQHGQQCPKELATQMSAFSDCIRKGYEPSTCSHLGSAPPPVVSIFSRHPTTPEGLAPFSLIENYRWTTCFSQAFAQKAGNLSAPGISPPTIRICFDRRSMNERTLQVMASPLPTLDLNQGARLLVVKMFQNNESCQASHNLPPPPLTEMTGCIFTDMRHPLIPPSQLCFDPSMDQLTLTTSDRRMGKDPAQPVSILVTNA